MWLNYVITYTTSVFFSAPKPPHRKKLKIFLWFICALEFIVVQFTKNYDKRDDFDFDIVNFPFLDGDVPGVPHMW